MSSVTLQPASDADLAALALGVALPGLQVADGGIETPEVLIMLRELAGRIRPGFDPAAWLVVAEAEIVGLVSLVQAPSAGVIIIGYGIAPSRRKRGHATAAVGALGDWARQDHRVIAIAAETSATNLPSQRVLAANDFTCTGRRDDAEDGALLCWRLATG